MSISLRNIAMVATVTLLVMFALNQLAARSATARRLTRGTKVAADKPLVGRIFEGEMGFT
ncbi:hypothetical protein LCGC14_0838070 [marine sediment metagenome]|uniref:Uncharacterized protein n=1 Tax=marine sediment metagenome TaxID=412755 RepID=A0A0F9PIL5_9ZZZZ